MSHLIIRTDGSVRSINAEIYLDLSELVDQAEGITDYHFSIEAEERVVLLDESAERVKALVRTELASKGNQSDWFGLGRGKSKEFT